MTTTAPVPGAQTSRERMDELVDGHYRAEETSDLAAIVAGFQPDAEHDVVGRPGPTLHGAAQIEEFYRDLFADLRIDRFEPVRRRYGADHVVDESVLHATATGHSFAPVAGPRDNGHDSHADHGSHRKRILERDGDSLP